MRKATVQIQYDAEKLCAIRQYMGKNDAALHNGTGRCDAKALRKACPRPSS
jgi:hypothetical protein